MYESIYTYIWIQTIVYIEYYIYLLYMRIFFEIVY